MIFIKHYVHNTNIDLLNEYIKCLMYVASNNKKYNEDKRGDCTEPTVNSGSCYSRIYTDKEFKDYIVPPYTNDISYNRYTFIIAQMCVYGNETKITNPVLSTITDYGSNGDLGRIYRNYFANMYELNKTGFNKYFNKISNIAQNYTDNYTSIEEDLKILVIIEENMYSSFGDGSIS